MASSATTSSRLAGRLLHPDPSVCCPGVNATALAARLERAAEHGNRGRLGSFVEVEPAGNGTVAVTLCERWFNGRYLLCEQLTSRRFDAKDEDALVKSAEYLVELQHQAAERNQLREVAASDVGDIENTAGRVASDSVGTADWLAELLQDYRHPR